MLPNKPKKGKIVAKRVPPLKSVTAVPKSVQKTFFPSLNEKYNVASSTHVPKPLTDTKNLSLISNDEWKYQKAKEKPEPNASIDNIVRTAIPLPKNGASVVMKKFMNRNRMNSSSINAEEKAVMSKVVLNAQKRTGKLNGGTEYEDYEGTTTPEVYQEIMNAKNGKVNPILGIGLASKDPAYRMATTTGRGTYAINPKNNQDIVYTDEYDFKNSFTQDPVTGKLKDNYMKSKTGDAAVDKYRSIRRNLALDDQGDLDPENGRTKFTLQASDTMNLPLNKKYKKEKKSTSF